MAKIALVASEITASSTTRTKTLLESYQKHIVSVFNNTTVTYETLSTFDLIVTVRTDSIDPFHQTITRLAEKGIPIIIGFLRSAVSSDTLLNVLGFISERIQDQVSESMDQRVVMSHPIFSESGLAVGSTFSSWNNFDYVCKIKREVVYNYVTVLADRSVSPHEVTMAYLRPMTRTTNNKIFKSKIMFLSSIYGQNVDYTPNYKPILDHIINFMLTPDFFVKGRVLSSDKTPSSNDLFIYEQSSGILVGKGRSDSEGMYEIRSNTNNPVFIVCTPNLANKRTQVIGSVLPEQVTQE